MSQDNIDYYSYEDDDFDSEESKVDWQAYFNKVWKGRKTITRTTITFTIIGFITALSMTKLYSVEVTLAPELGNNGGGGSGFGGIASMLSMGGIQLGNSSDAYSLTLYPEVVSSTPFMFGLFDVPVKDLENEIDTTFYGYLTREKFSVLALPGKAIGAILKYLITDTDTLGDQSGIDIFRLTKQQNKVIKYLRKTIVAEVDKTTGETKITVTLDNPLIAATIADSVCSHLRDYIINYRTSKAREDLNYFQQLADESHREYEKASLALANYQDHNRGLVLHSIISEGTRLQNELNISSQVYSQMEQRAKMARAKVQEEKPVFAVIQPASVPLESINSRLKVLIIFMFMGFVFSTAWVVIGRDFYHKVRNMYNTAKES